MSIVSSAKVTARTYTSPALLVGDIVSLSVGVDRASSRLTGAPSGWQRGAAADLSIPGGAGASGFGSTANVVFWRRATVAGTLTADFSAMSPRSLEILSTVVRGATSLAGVAVQTNNAQDFAYPAVAFDDPMTGDVLHMGVCLIDYVSPPTPSGDTAVESTQVIASGYRNGAGQQVQRRSWLAVSTRPMTAATSTPVATTTQRVYGVGMTLVFATVAGPPAPALSSPKAGSADLAAGFPISWVASGAQTGYAIRRRLTSGPGAWGWWNGSTFGAATETITSGAVTSVAIPAGVLSNSATSYDIEVATVGDVSRPSLGTYARVTVVGKAAPTLSTAVVTPKTGSVVTSLTPTVTLSGAAGSGGVLSGYRVRVDQDFGAGFVQVLDSGTVASPWAVSVAQAASLTNGAPIRFRSVTVQDGTQESAQITTGPYALGAPTPAAPTVAAVYSPHPLSGAPGAEVTITSAPLGTAYMVRAYRDGVLIGEFPTTGQVILSDYLVPSSGPVVYSATVTSGDGVSSVLATSPFGVAATLVVNGDLTHCWLSDPMDPSTAVLAHLVQDGDRSRSLNTSVFQTIGAAVPVTHTTLPATAPSGSLALSVHDPASEEAVIALLTSGKRLMFRGHEETDLLTRDVHPARDLYFTPVGEASTSRPADGPWSWRHISFGWVSTNIVPVAADTSELILDGGAP